MLLALAEEETRACEDETCEVSICLDGAELHARSFACGGEHVARRLGRAFGALPWGLGLGLDPPQTQLGEYRPLAREIVEEGLSADLDAPGDVVDGGLVEAAITEEGLADANDLLSQALLLALSQSHRHKVY